MEPLAKQSFPSLSGCLYAAHGAYMILAGAALAVLSWLIPLVLVKVVDSDVIDPKTVPQTARSVIENRAYMPLLALPVVVFGVLVLNKVPWRWLWVLLGLLSMLLPLVLLVYTFVSTIGLLYRSDVPPA